MPLKFLRLFYESFANEIFLLSSGSASLSIQSSHSDFLKYQKDEQQLQQLSQDEMVQSCHHMLMTDIKRLSRNQISADTLQTHHRSSKVQTFCIFPFCAQFLKKTVIILDCVSVKMCLPQDRTLRFVLESTPLILTPLLTNSLICHMAWYIYLMFYTRL